MGHRMEIYLSENDAQRVINIASAFDLDARVIGHCEASDSKRLTIVSENGKFDY